MLLNPFRFSLIDYATTVLQDAPALYYRLEDTSGSTLTDYSGFSRSGTFTNITTNQASLLPNGAGRSFLFDGSTSYATAGSSTVANVNRNFSAECWFQAPAASVASTSYSLMSVGAGGWYIRITSSSTNIMHLEFLRSQIGSIALSTTALTANGIYHVVLTVDGSGNYVVYLNGTADMTGNTAQTFNGSQTQILQIGRDITGTGTFSEFYKGGIDEVAFYTTALSATRVSAHNRAASVIASDTNPGGDVATLLAHFDNVGATSFVESSSNAATLTYGGASGSIVATPSKFGAGSFYNGTAATGNGGGAYFYTPAHSRYAFGSTGNYTIDFWFNRFSAPGSTCALVGIYGGSVRWSFFWRASNHVAVYNATSATFMEGSTSLVSNTWYHYAFCKSGTSCYLFLNGHLEATSTNSISTDITPWVHLGDNAFGATPSTAGGEQSPCYFDELRISNTCRWTTNFTPPTAPYTS